MTIITEAMIERAARGLWEVNHPNPPGFAAWGDHSGFGPSKSERANTLAQCSACLEVSGLAAEVERLTGERDDAREQHGKWMKIGVRLSARAEAAESRILELERAASGLAEAVQTWRDARQAMVTATIGLAKNEQLPPRFVSALADAECALRDYGGASGLADPSTSAREGRIAPQWEDDPRTLILLRVMKKARELCAEWPPHQKFPAQLVAHEVELTMLLEMAAIALRARIAELSGKGE